MKLSISLSVVALGFMLSSGVCHKMPNNHCEHEVVFNYQGPLAGDGCEWVATIDGVAYHPAQIDDAMKQENLHARCNYVLTGDTFYCGLMPMKLPVVQITCFKFLEE